MYVTLFKTLLLFYISFAIYGLEAQTLYGHVQTATATPIVGVEVHLGPNIISKTNAKGVFVLPNTIKPPVELTLRHPEYQQKSVIFKRTNVTFQLQPLEQVQNLAPVNLSFSSENKQKLLAVTTTLNAENLERYSPIDLVSAINETPGVYIQNGALNTNRIVIRGVGSRTLYGTNKIRAYYNGIPITNGTGSTTIDAFDAENLHSITLIKGPKASTYGTNLGGTLLLNTQHAEKGTTQLKNALSLGSFGLIKNSFNFATADDELELSFNYNYLKTDGFRENSDYNRKAAFLQANYKLNEKSRLGLLINHIDYDAQIASSISRTDFDNDPSQAAYTWKTAQGYETNKYTLIGLNYTHHFSENFSNTSSVFYSYLDHYEPRPFNILEEYTHGYGARSLFEKDFTFLNQSAHLYFGGEIYSDAYRWHTLENLYETNGNNGSLEGQVLSDNVEYRQNLNLFASTTLPFTPQFSAQIGLNINNTNYRFRDHFNSGTLNKNANRNFETIVAPSLNLAYQFSTNLKTYLSISRGFNYPSIEETLTPEGLINPDLGPETGINYELGSQIFFFKRHVKLDIAAYILDIDNLLVADRVGEDQYIGRNAGKTQHKGLELALSSQHQLNANFSLSPYVNTELNDHKFVEFVDNDSNFSGNALTGVPTFKMNAGCVIRYKNIQLNTNGLHVGTMPMNDANTLYTAPYTVLNSKLSYNNNLSKQLALDLYFGLNNITSAHYASSILINAVGFGDAEPRYYYPGMPRHWYSGFKLRYKL
ncbi:TonB-dependent receptor family protein [Winogradskyella rapida]|uniref:TonB-dependent receptor family protein n=1 Tax=Winogradskyella rapida TaxID=549701 RepID=A0ABW3KV21_9FLAO